MRLAAMACLGRIVSACALASSASSAPMLGLDALQLGFQFVALA